jgi:hypothetical protein
MSGASQPSSSVAEISAVAVSSAGGHACHARVQVRDASANPWRCYGMFRRIDQAQECVQSLNDDGRQARLVRFAIAPVAG